MGWINNATAAVWRTGHALNPLARRRSEPSREPGYDWSRSSFEIDWSGLTSVIGTQTAGQETFIAPDTALQSAAVWACISVISKDIASSTWGVFREQPNGDRDQDRENSLWRLLNVAPNPEMTAFAFRESMLVSALLWGNGYAEIERDVNRRPVALWPLESERVHPRRTEEGILYYEVYQPNSETLAFDPRDIFHIHGPGADGLVGFNVTWYAALLFGHALACDRFGLNFYQNGAHAGQVLSTDAELNPDQAEQMRAGVLKQLQGAKKQLGLFIATHGAKLTNTMVEPEKAQFLETRKHLIEEVCRWFDVPPHKIGMLDRATFNNIEEMGKDYVSKLIPWCERLRQEAERKLILARNITTRIEVEWLAEGNAKDKAEADSTLVNAGIQSRNEVRKRRGLNRSTDENADKLTVQTAMTTLDKIGAEPEPAMPPESDDEEMPEEEMPSARVRLLKAYE